MNLVEFWFKLDSKIRFLFVGALNAAISYFIFVVALYFLGENSYQACVALQWGISSVFSYTNQKFLVFRTKGNYFNEYLKCCSSWLVSYLINALILEILVKFLNAYIAQFLAIFFVSIITYVLFKYFAFKPKT